MMLDCLIQINDNVSPKNSFQRFVVCNLYLGIVNTSCKNSVKEPYLAAVTSTKTLKYKVVNNIQRIFSKEIHHGKVGIMLCYPSHCILINCNNEKLQLFLRLLYKLSDEKKFSQLKNVPTIPEPYKLKFISKPKVKNRNCIKKTNTDNTNDERNIISKIANLKLRAELRSNLCELHLSNSNIKYIPIELGRISLVDVELEGNDLSNTDMLWLEELPIRKSLVKLNLSRNKISSFPSALVDFYSLQTLNLRKNSIEYIPGGIGRLQCLKSLNISENNLHYLPADITYLKLENLDLTLNYLTSNKICDYQPKDENCFKATLRLEDLAALSIDRTLRCRLTIKDCPPRLLEKLRCSSRCVCEKITTTYREAQYFSKLNRIKFSDSYWIHPQKDSSGKEDNIFLQYHLCTFYNRCEHKKFRLMQSQLNCFGLIF